MSRAWRGSRSRRGRSRPCRRSSARSSTPSSKVAELDLADVEPTSHPLDLVNVWDEDEPRPSLSREDALANAPDPAGGAFRVPSAG